MKTQEEEAIEAFCQELALALRRITGRVVEIKPGDLPVPLKESEQESPQTKEGATNTEETEESQRGTVCYVSYSREGTWNANHIG